MADLEDTETHRVTWFTPDRPVAGTVYVHPDDEDSDDA